MTITAFLDKDQVTQGMRPVERAPAGLSEVISLSFKSNLQNFRSNSADQLTLQENQKRIAAVEEILGRTIKPEDASGFEPFSEDAPRFGRPGRIPSPSAQNIRFLNEAVRARHNERFIQQAIDELKAREPERFASVPTREQVKKNAIERANMSRQEYENAIKRTSSFKRIFGGLVGGFGAFATDPINVATLPLGVGASRSILKTVLVEAGIGAGAETAIQPFVLQWQRELGQEYGFGDILENVGLAALCGGSFAAAVRGITAAGSAIFSKLSEMRKLSKRAKTAANLMSRAAHIRENNPFLKTARTRLAENRKHMESIREASRAFENSERIDDANLKVSETEFLNINTTPKRGDTEITKTSLDEIRRYQEGAKQAETITPQNRQRFTPDTLPQQILDKAAAKRGTLTRNDFEPEELQMLESAGITPNRQGQFRKAGLIAQRTERENAGQLQDLRGKEKEHITQFNARQKEAALKTQNLEEQVEGIAGAIRQTQRLLDEETSSPDIAEELLRRADSPERIAAEETNFNALAEANPNLKITREDGSQVTLSQLVDEFAEDERVLNEIRTCGLG